jgi:hypothetical protein
MVIDFQHHYIPVELAKKLGLYSETGKTMLQEGGCPRRPCTGGSTTWTCNWITWRARRLSCLLGWSAPILEGKPALDELRRAIKHLGLHGVTITSQVNDLSLDSPKLYDFYETGCALNAPVFVHPAWVPTGYEHLKDYDLQKAVRRLL